MTTFLLPTWKGRLSLDKDDGDIFRVFFEAWGEERALQYFKRLANQQIEFRSGHTLQAQLLAAGEIAAAPWLYSHRLMMLMDNGAPVGLLFLDPVVSVPKMFMFARRDSASARGGSLHRLGAFQRGTAFRWHDDRPKPNEKGSATKISQGSETRKPSR